MITRGGGRYSTYLEGLYIITRGQSYSMRKGRLIMRGGRKTQVLKKRWMVLYRHRLSHYMARKGNTADRLWYYKRSKG